MDKGLQRHFLCDVINHHCLNFHGVLTKPSRRSGHGWGITYYSFMQVWLVIQTLSAMLNSVGKKRPQREEHAGWDEFWATSARIRGYDIWYNVFQQFHENLGHLQFWVSGPNRFLLMKHDRYRTKKCYMELLHKMLSSSTKLHIPYYNFLQVLIKAIPCTLPGSLSNTEIS